MTIPGQDKQLEELARELRGYRAEVRAELTTIRGGLEEVRFALLGEMSPDGHEGLVAKVRRADGLARGGRKLAVGAMVAALAGWVRDLIRP